MSNFIEDWFLNQDLQRRSYFLALSELVIDFLLKQFAIHSKTYKVLQLRIDLSSFQVEFITIRERLKGFFPASNVSAKGALVLKLWSEKWGWGLNRAFTVAIAVAF